MREPYWHKNTATLYAGNARQILAEMPSGSVDCIVTSPPAWIPPGDSAGPMPEGRGHEVTPGLYISGLRRDFAEAHRVLSDTGTAWLIAKDRHAGPSRGASPSAGSHSRAIRDQAMTGIPAASLIGLPWQVAFALHDDGWIIRNAIVWHQPASESHEVDDRLVLSYELIFLLVKQGRYHFDRGTLVKSAPSSAESQVAGFGTAGIPAERRHSEGKTRRWSAGTRGKTIGRCRGRDREAGMPDFRQRSGIEPSGNPAEDVWQLPARPFAGAMPIAVPSRCIAAGCRPGGTVLDMYASAATGLAVRELERSFIGVTEDEAACRLVAQSLRGGPRDGGTR